MLMKRVPSSVERGAGDQPGTYALGDADGVLSTEFVDGVKNMILGYQMLLPGAEASGGMARPSEGQGTEEAQKAGVGAEVGEEDAVAPSRAEDANEHVSQLVQTVQDIFVKYVGALQEAVCVPDMSQDVTTVVAQLDKWHEVASRLSHYHPRPSLALSPPLTSTKRSIPRRPSFPPSAHQKVRSCKSFAVQ